MISVWQSDVTTLTGQVANEEADEVTEYVIPSSRFRNVDFDAVLSFIVVVRLSSQPVEVGQTLSRHSRYVASLLGLVSTANKKIAKFMLWKGNKQQVSPVANQPVEYYWILNNIV